MHGLGIVPLILHLKEIRIQDALRLELVAGLLVRDFAFQIEDAPGTPDQTEYLFHFHAPNRFKKTLADWVDLC